MEDTLATVSPTVTEAEPSADVAVNSTSEKSLAVKTEEETESIPRSLDPSKMSVPPALPVRAHDDGLEPAQNSIADTTASSVRSIRSDGLASEAIPPQLPARHPRGDMEEIELDSPKLPPRRTEASPLLSPPPELPSRKHRNERITSLASDFQFTGFAQKQRSISGLSTPVEPQCEEIDASKYKADSTLFGFVAQLELVDEYVELLRDTEDAADDYTVDLGWEGILADLDERRGLDSLYEDMAGGKAKGFEWWFTKSYLSESSNPIDGKWSNLLNSFEFGTPNDDKVRQFLQFSLNKTPASELAYRIIRSTEFLDPLFLISTLESEPGLAKSLTSALEEESLFGSVSPQFQTQILLRGFDPLLEQIVLKILESQSFDIGSFNDLFSGTPPSIFIPHYAIWKEYHSLKHGLKYPEKSRQVSTKLANKQRHLLSKKEKSQQQYNELLNNYQQLNEERFHNERLIGNLSKANDKLKAELATRTRELNSMLSNFDVIKINNDKNLGIAKINFDLSKEVAGLQKDVAALKQEIEKIKK
ncbi:unnamed protein product [Kuraishia capsulata CBS 1993]|uniref:Uncharacterized protein n=1 Tax=Kuraishia capsulata CBS 1993 TaxID=1382522 RepID=W6MUH5_9ASCO|nr:uncharacterized protein KUCA_T00005275001 [Kuraishia capsulata CBS 1993]CDK29287.1 unnamed protein product [Kuraishia capsulata CBS 1993]